MPPRRTGDQGPDDGTALLVMEQVDGQSLGQLPASGRGRPPGRTGAEVDSLRRGGIAHRSLRAANVMIEDGERPWLTDFSFSELAATPRQINLDLAELLASLATLVGADRATASAIAVIGTPARWPPQCRCFSRWPCRPPPGTRPAAAWAARRTPGRPRPAGWTDRPVSGPPAAGQAPGPCWPSRPPAGAFYFVLPQLAQVGRQLARAAIGALGLAAGHHRPPRR